MPVPVDLSKLSDVVKNNVVKKNVYNNLVTKVNNIDTSGFLLKAKYDTDKSEFENKIPDTSGLVKKTYYDAKITETESKILDVSILVTKAALTTVENKIPDVTNCDTKVKEIENKLNNHNHNKYITTPEFNNLAADVINIRLAKTNLVAKTNFDNTASSLDNKIVTNKTKNGSIENELEKN